jgi:hypothetical protein
MLHLASSRDPTLLKYPYYLERYGYNTSIGTILVLYLEYKN